MGKYFSYSYNCNETSSGTTLTNSISAKNGDIIFASVVTRSDATFSSDWELLHQGSTIDIASNSQRAYYLKKVVDSDGNYTISVTQLKSARIYINLIVFSGIDDIIYNPGYEVFSSTPTAGPYTVTRPNYPCVVWICHCVQWNTGSHWKLNNIDSTVDSSQNSQPRLSNFIDIGDLTTNTFLPNYTPADYAIDCVQILNPNIFDHKYNSIEDIFNQDDLSALSRLKAEVRDDDGVFSYPTNVDWMIFNGNPIANMYIGSNSFFGFNTSSEQLKVNRRDNQSKTFYQENGTLWEKYNFVRYRWIGYCPYSSSYYDNPNYALTFDIAIFDTGDICIKLLELGTSASYDGTFSLTASTTYTYNKLTLESPYVTFYSRDAENKTFSVDYNIISLLPPYKYLFGDGSKFYTIASGVLTELVGVTTLTASDFETYGIDEVTDTSLLFGFNDLEVYAWSNVVVPELEIKVDATPYPQTVVTNDIAITHESITGIEQVTSEYTGTPRCAISVDSGVTWKMWNSHLNVWATLSESDTGMLVSELETISATDWNNLADTNDYMMFKFTLSNINDTITNIVINFTN